MLLKVLDGTATSQTVIAKGQEAPTDRSGTIASTGVSQTLMAANATRSGYVVQNNGASVMWLNEIGAAASAIGGSYAIAPGAVFPPPGWPVTAAAIAITGTAAQAFTAREW